MGIQIIPQGGLAVSVVPSAYPTLTPFIGTAASSSPSFFAYGGTAVNTGASFNPGAGKRFYLMGYVVGSIAAASAVTFNLSGFDGNVAAIYGTLPKVAGQSTSQNSAVPMAYSQVATNIVFNHDFGAGQGVWYVWGFIA